MDVVIKAVQMGTVKTGVVVAGDQHLVPVWKVADPLQKIKRLCLGSRHREITAVHEDVRLREVPQAAVDTVGVGYVQKFQVHGAKLINLTVGTHFLRAPVPFQCPVKIFKAFLTKEGCINEFKGFQAAAVAHRHVGQFEIAPQRQFLKAVATGQLQLLELAASYFELLKVT